jgi:hypothetical protein
MKAKTRLEIVWETHEITTISFKGTSSSMIFCQLCKLETQHLSIAEVAIIARISEADVFRLAEAGSIHSTERAGGKLLICVNSVTNFEKDEIEKNLGDR